MTTDEMIEMTARAIMKLGCGYHFGGEQVLCCDPRVGDEKDAYGDPLLRDKSQCDCMLSARAALAAILLVMREDIERAHRTVQYDPAPYTKGKAAIRARFNQIMEGVGG